MTASTIVPLTLSMFLVGCVGIQFDRREVAAPDVGALRGGFAQYCTYHFATDLPALNQFLDAQAKRGWRLAGVGGRDPTVFCFVADLAVPAPALQPVQRPAATGAF